MFYVTGNMSLKAVMVLLLHTVSSVVCFTIVLSIALYLIVGKYIYIKLGGRGCFVNI